MLMLSDSLLESRKRNSSSTLLFGCKLSSLGFGLYHQWRRFEADIVAPSRNAKVSGHSLDSMACTAYLCAAAALLARVRS